MQLKKYNNSFTPDPNQIFWRYLKVVLNNDQYLSNIINIANTCIDLGHWYLYFKIFALIIIPKPNKVSYDSSKMFWLIFLFNILGKLIKKAIGRRLQYQSIASNFIHSNQLGRLKQQSITDAGIILTHLIYLSWIKEFQTSSLAFNIAQFLPSLNYQILSLILDKASFDFRILFFFSNYLINRKTQYI